MNTSAVPRRSRNSGASLASVAGAVIGSVERQLLPGEVAYWVDNPEALKAVVLQALRAAPQFTLSRAGGIAIYYGQTPEDMVSKGRFNHVALNAGAFTPAGEGTVRVEAALLSADRPILRTDVQEYLQVLNRAGGNWQLGRTEHLLALASQVLTRDDKKMSVVGFGTTNRLPTGQDYAPIICIDPSSKGVRRILSLAQTSGQSWDPPCSFLLVRPLS